MSTFVSRLPVGSSLVSKSSALLGQQLETDRRVKGTIPSNLAARKEWVAALAWLADHCTPTATDCRSLSNDERKVLATLLGIDGAKAGLAGRISAALSSAHTSEDEELPDDTTFLDLVQSRGSSLDRAMGIMISSFTKQAAIARIGDSPLGKDINLADLQTVLERCAMHLWVSQAQDASAFSDLPPSLLISLGRAVGISGAPDGKLIQLLSVIFDIRPADVLDVDPDHRRRLARSSDDALPLMGSPSLWDQKELSYGTFRGSSSEREEIKDIWKKYRTLGLKITQILSTDELKDANAKIKAMKGFAGSGDDYAMHHPYSKFPWLQSLDISDNEKFDATREGRKLMNACRFTNSKFLTLLDQMSRTAHDAEWRALWAEYDTAKQSGQLGLLLLAVELIKSAVRRLFEGLKTAAESLARQYPIPVFMELRDGRVSQCESLNSFFESLSRNISEQSKHRANTDATVAGFWITFMDSFRTKASSSEDIEAVAKLGASFGAAGTNPASSRGSTSGGGASFSSGGGSGLTSSGSASSRSLGGTPPPKSNVAASGGDRGKRYTSNVTWPSSADILGPVLGVDGPTFKCHQCNESGHWKGECPVFWGRKGKPLPGWNENGKKIKKMWDGENPTKECFKLWLKFVQDSDNYPAGGQPASVSGAPELSDFELRARKGAGP